MRRVGCGVVIAFVALLIGACGDDIAHDTNHANTSFLIASTTDVTGHSLRLLDTDGHRVRDVGLERPLGRRAALRASPNGSLVLVSDAGLVFDHDGHVVWEGRAPVGGSCLEWLTDDELLESTHDDASGRTTFTRIGLDGARRSFASAAGGWCATGIGDGAALASSQTCHERDVGVGLMELRDGTSSVVAVKGLSCPSWSPDGKTLLGWIAPPVAADMKKKEAAGSYLFDRDGHQIGRVAGDVWCPTAVNESWR